MPTLTRLALNPTHPAVRDDDHDLHATHRRLTGLADGWPDRPRLLWARPTPSLLLVQAAQPVNPDRLPDGYTLATEHADIGSILDGLTRGQQITIRTIVNPTYKPRDRNRIIYQPRERPGWLAGLLTPALTVHQVNGRFLGFREGHKPGRDKSITLSWWYATVTATVSDPQVFARLVCEGIGHGRAFGCGLLDITPGPAPANPVADVRCPACAASMPVAPLPVECARCHVGVTADGTLGGFTPDAVRWWQDCAHRMCISKCGFRFETEARNVMEETDRERPRHANAGTPGVWHCPLCDQWHFGTSQPGDPLMLPPVVPVLSGYALRERATRWNQADPGPTGLPRSDRDARRAAAKTAIR